METTIKTLIIKSKGRKYFDCLIGGYKAKLVINDISMDLAIDRVVKVEVNDLSERSKFGCQLKFEPLQILDDRDAEALRKAAIGKKEAEKWLAYAEDDARQGMQATNAIVKAYTLCSQYEHLSERLTQLKARVAENEIQYKQHLLAQDKQRTEQKAQQAQKRQMRRLFPLSRSPSLNTTQRLGNKVVVFYERGKSFRISEDDPSIHGSQLLGFEGSMGAYSYYREATEAEILELERAESQAKTAIEARDALQTELRLLKKRFKEEGERPLGEHAPQGTRLLDTATIYGGGDWFVIGSDHIWFIVNNGGDGDNWAHNNIRTGGAGAIGYRLPHDELLADRLRELAAMAINSCN